jgi:hypothetical protein
VPLPHGKNGASLKGDWWLKGFGLRVVPGHKTHLTIGIMPSTADAADDTEAGAWRRTINNGIVDFQTRPPMWDR